MSLPGWQVKLAEYDTSRHDPGAPRGRLLLWYGIGYPLVRSYFLTSSRLRADILRWFGASIGCSVVLKPGLRVKYPWKLTVGANSWIGESVWLDSIEKIVIGENVCISQNAYLCTGNHDWSSSTFELRAAPIFVDSEAWLAARTCTGPGVTIGRRAVLTLGSVATTDLAPHGIYTGNPAVRVAARDSAEV